MTDLEMTRLCAEALMFSMWGALDYDEGSYVEVHADGTVEVLMNDGWDDYDPLTNSAQAWELVRRFRVGIGWHQNSDCIATVETREIPAAGTPDLNRAVVAIVAHMQKFCRRYLILPIPHS